MIDREARGQMAELLRHLGSGAITNDYFDDQAFTVSGRSQDLGVRAVYEWAWLFYDDFKCYRFRGRYRLPDDFRTKLARCVVFLHSDCEYQWPTGDTSLWWYWRDVLLTWVSGVAAAIGIFSLTIGIVYSPLLILAALALFACWLIYRYSYACLAEEERVRSDAMNQLGDYAAWPFLRNDDLAAARAKPRLLAAQSA